MKKTRKLIPALAMLLISAVMMSTASFAWFSLNSTVTAGNMEVKATTGANLYIAKGASVAVDAITGISVDDLSVNATALNPANVVKDGTGTAALIQDAATFTTEPTVNGAGAAETFTKIGTVSATAPANEAGKDISDYAAVAFVSIARKQTVAATYDLTATCSITLDAESQLNKALRVAVVINNNVYIATDVNTASGTATFTITGISGLEDNTAYSAALLVWFEGEDSDCTANNAVTLSANTATWTFVAA